MLFILGEAELFRDQGIELAHKMRKQGVYVECEIYQDMCHLFQVLGYP